jgi:peptidoglycan-associated lipoprotein
MFKRSAKNFVMAVVMTGLVFGISACSKKNAAEDTGMTQNDAAATEQPATTADDSAASAAAAEKDAFVAEDIHFDFDSSAITPEAAEILKKKAQFLSANADVNVTIEGHCDDRGTNEYNMALGDKRAQAAKAYLVELGVAEARLSTVSYGEEKPLIAGAKTEEEHAKNRRGHCEIK